MRKAIKVTLIIGAVLICLGLIIVLITGIIGGWSFAPTDWESRLYNTESGVEITDINLDFSAGSLEVGFYDDDVIKVEYPHSERITTECRVADKTLIIRTVTERYVQFLWFNNIPTTKVYIPYKMLLGLKFRVNAGTVTVKGGLFKDIELKMNAGTLNMYNIECNNFNVEMNAGTMNLSNIQSGTFSAGLSAGTLKVARLKCDEIELNLSAGTATVGVEGAKRDYSIWTKVSAGSCNVKNQNGTTVKTLKVEVSAGSVKVNFDN